MAGEYATPGLLGPGALAGARLGVSVSDSPDLARLGLEETHVRLALGEIARAVLLGGGCIAYGGHLEPTGYTAFLQSELERYGRRDRPLAVYLAWQEHRARTLAELEAAQRQLGLYGRIVFLDALGASIDPGARRGPQPQPIDDPDLRAHALTGLRRRLVHETDARVLMGGRRSGFHGAMPGVLEEALYAIEADLLRRRLWRRHLGWRSRARACLVGMARSRRSRDRREGSKRRCAGSARTGCQRRRLGSHIERPRSAGEPLADRFSSSERDRVACCAWAGAAAGETDAWRRQR